MVEVPIMNHSGMIHAKTVPKRFGSVRNVPVIYLL